MRLWLSASRKRIGISLRLWRTPPIQGDGAKRLAAMVDESTLLDLVVTSGHVGQVEGIRLGWASRSSLSLRRRTGPYATLMGVRRRPGARSVTGSAGSVSQLGHALQLGVFAVESFYLCISRPRTRTAAALLQGLFSGARGPRCGKREKISAASSFCGRRAFPRASKWVRISSRPGAQS